jgi:hypothetical protein
VANHALRERAGGDSPRATDRNSAVVLPETVGAMTAIDQILPNDVLPSAQFGDCFSIIVTGRTLDAMTAAKQTIGRPPRWVGRLMALRNGLVRPLGLVTKPTAKQAPDAYVGMFPVISRAPSRVVLGFDDRHLDFRVVVEVRDAGGARQEVSAITLVETHNSFGRIYLAIIKPFHRIIVPAMLAQLRRQAR